MRTFGSFEVDNYWKIYAGGFSESDLSMNGDGMTTSNLVPTSTADDARKSKNKVKIK